jgi:hypothetical protein
MQADPDVDDLLAMYAEYFARRAESVARCRRVLSEYTAPPAELPVVAFLTAQFDQLDAAVRHGAGLVAAVRRDRVGGLRSPF